MPDQIVWEQTDPSDAWAMFSHVGPGALAFDIGANRGAVAQLLHARFEKVIAFEPAIESYRYLAAHNGPGVLPVNLAVSDRNGSVQFNTYSVATDALGMLVTGNRMGFSWGNPTGVRAVESRTLDTLTRMYGDPDFVKIDTEGHETQVIAGGEILFRKHHPELFIEIHSAEDGDTVRTLLPDYEFTQIEHPGYQMPKFAHYKGEHYYLYSEGQK